MKLLNLILCICVLFFFQLDASLSILDSSLKDSNKVIMINPAGHAGDPGRRLFNGFERAETLKFAQDLQKKLETNYNYKVLLTRLPGDKIVDFQNASFANRLNIDLFLSLHLYKNDSSVPKFYIYYYLSDPIRDLVNHKVFDIRFLPVLQAHHINCLKTRSMCNSIKNSISSIDNTKFINLGPYGIPLKPLCGVISPAILIEIGINQDRDWGVISDVIVENIKFVWE